MVFKSHSLKGKLRSVLFVLCTFLFLSATLSSFKTDPAGVAATQRIRQNFLLDVEGLKNEAGAFTSTLRLFEQRQATLQQAQEAFCQLKYAYKKTEYLLEYLDPELAKSLNGAPLPKVVVEQQPYLALHFKTPTYVTFPPEGLQVLEEMLFAEEMSPAAAQEALPLAFRLEEKLNLFGNNVRNQSFTNKQLLESLREQLVRAMTLGVTGFDAPAAGHSLEYTVASLKPVLAALMLYREGTSGTVQQQCSESIALVQGALAYLGQHKDFDSFNRLYFIRELADPAYGALTRLQHLLLQQRLSTTDFSKPVNDLASSLFDERFLQPAFYAKQDQANANPELVQLGKLLFFDPVLSSNNQRSCASCHAPAKAFTDGQVRSLAFDAKGKTLRNSPTLLNASLGAAYFWDSRAQYLQDQIPDVINKADELHGNYEQVVEKLQQSTEYRKLFKKAFKGQPETEVSSNTVNRAIAAYVQNLVALDSPFDRYMRRQTSDYSEAAIRGANLFMGKAGCGTCHFAPAFNGTVPPRFLESETEVLGVPATADLTRATLDADSGRAGVIGAAAFLHSFKTPTVRNTALTAPYMHNGVFSTLEEVVAFYDAGGGAGLGLVVPSQTLPSSPLNLTTEEKQDLVAFMHSLTDTTATTSVPKQLPSFPKGSALNKRIVGGQY
ncbi:cytochrome c peroxidase [Pontibacter brevis]